MLVPNSKMEEAKAIAKASMQAVAVGDPQVMELLSALLFQKFNGTKSKV